MYDELIGELHIVASGVQSKRRRELLEKAADAIEELCRKEKFHAFIWNTLGNDRMRLLIDAYREQEETE